MECTLYNLLTSETHTRSFITVRQVVFDPYSQSLRSPRLFLPEIPQYNIRQRDIAVITETV